MKKQKVFFVQKIDETTLETEGIWCMKKGDNYIVDNIPFVAKRVALGDIIKVEYDKTENAYYFDEFIEVSGNSTIRLYFEDETIIQEIRNQLNDLGCESELFLDRKLIAINVPKEKDYIPIKVYLDKGEKSEVWRYEESCLSHQY